MSGSYKKLVPKSTLRWIAYGLLLCMVVVDGKGYKPVKGKGCSRYIGMDAASLYGRQGGQYTLEQCAEAVKRLDGYEGCKGRYFFFETSGYCNCPTDDCTTSPNLKAGGAGQLYEFDPYTQASTTKPHARKQYPGTCPGCKSSRCTCGTNLGYDKHHCCDGHVDQCTDYTSSECSACQNCHPVSIDGKCSVRMDFKYQSPNVQAKDIAIRFAGEDVVITGSVTGYKFVDPKYCPGCVRQVFLQLYDLASVSYIGVQQIRCTYSISQLGFAPFAATFKGLKPQFEAHDIQLRIATDLEYCDTWKGKFSPKYGVGAFQKGIIAFIGCPAATTAVTCDGTNTGSRADHTSERQPASTGYEAPGQKLGATLIFPCRQGYSKGVVTYHCSKDAVFTTQDRCVKMSTTPAPKGVWYALEATGCSTKCGAKEGSGSPGKVVCSKGYDAGCDSRTKPQPNRCKATPACMSACNMNDLLGLAGTHFQCTLALLGVRKPCTCLCTFAESDIREFTSCAFGSSRLNLYAQWQSCKSHDPRCGKKNDVVVVHGRNLRR